MACWIAVAAADHVSRGVQDGFMQVCHGKGGPLKRLKEGDHVVYYSSVEVFGEKTPLQSFTAIGEVKDQQVYQVSMSDTFHPYRRDVNWYSAHPAPIRPLLSLMEFSRGKTNWAYPMRFGLFEISEHDFGAIASAMCVER
ncbi:EVE domain-containing protein [Marinomonas sp. CT5]|uniref:EVE domain-containing protein n=1 Tax=Marinomonas sp. CT5 TaxID=2066133 RepID=UPI001BAF5545|nr:EVE domain-containing protein [Marinomonas sp. CT5]QUX94146.1 EVE domain-containing protein [Marinomonas sp. CT5]